MKRISALIFIFILVLPLSADRGLMKLKQMKEEKRIALIIGNNSYENLAKLKNPINDARAMRSILKERGFSVIYKENATKRDMKKLLKKFSKRLSPNSIGMYFFAGHGISVNGKNYLLGVDSLVEEEDEVEYESLALNLITSKLKNSNSRLNIIVLDACRNSPFGRGSTGGQAPIGNASGMLVAYATEAGATASDGKSGKNGLFTRHLIKAIQKPGFTLGEVFKKTREDVYLASHEKQSPGVYDQTRGEFYFTLPKTLSQKVQKTTIAKSDTIKPKVEIIEHSYAIQKGGSALIIVKATDENLDEVFIETNFGKRFKMQPFYKDDYFISLVAWPITEKKFSIHALAIDRAGNQSLKNINITNTDSNYRVRKINLSKGFLNGMSLRLADRFSQTKSTKSPLKKFIILNDTIHKKSDLFINKMTRKISDKKMDTFNILPFKPLKDASKVASYGDKRIFNYKNRHLCDTYHMGVDLASTKNAKIFTSNRAEVIFAGNNGIYGNGPILDHGLGLYTMYGHCAIINNTQGDFVQANSYIAQTGRTGLAVGDHLHFSVFVQGIAVKPIQWMDKKWINLNITSVINKAKNHIN